MKYFTNDTKSAFDAKVMAQFIAFAPMVFEASRLLRNFNILSVIQTCGKEGMTLEEVTKKVEIPPYGVKVLLEAGLGIGLVYWKDGRFLLTKTGHFMVNDTMTRVNMDFSHDVCYEGMFDLERAIREQRPAGLEVFGNWRTIYEGLASLPRAAQKSWFEFDQYYSDFAFPKALPHVFKHGPKKILDIGGNTGKWALLCAAHDPNVSLTIADLPGQIKMASEAVAKSGLQGRVEMYETDVLAPGASLPQGHDAIWMSQFLDCFSPDQIVSILKRAVEVMDDSTNLYVLETYWDRQSNEAAAFCLQQTSLYFTCLANGNSQMYHSDDMKQCLREVGLEVKEELDEIGLYHTLTRCQKTGAGAAGSRSR